MEKKHVLAALVAVAFLAAAFTIGSELAGVPDERVSRTLTTLLGLMGLMGAQLWSKVDTDKQLEAIRRTAEVAKEAAQDAAAGQHK